MLQLKPNCENCDKSLVAHSAAYICTFECTFCPNCSKNVLTYICPNCQGNLEKRPIRPSNLLDKYPPLTKEDSN